MRLARCTCSAYPNALVLVLTPKRWVVFISSVYRWVRGQQASVRSVSGSLVGEAGAVVLDVRAAHLRLWIVSSARRLLPAGM
jgi:hypothetical protein